MAMEAITSQTGQLPNSLVARRVSERALFSSCDFAPNNSFEPDPTIGNGSFGGLGSLMQEACRRLAVAIADTEKLLRNRIMLRNSLEAEISEWKTSTYLLSMPDFVVTSPDIKFCVSPSPKGGIEIEIGSDTIHVPKQFSAQHPLVQMLLLAELKSNHFLCPKSLAPKSIVKMFEKSHSSECPSVYEAGWISTSHQSQGAITGAAYELNHRENISRNNEPILPVLFDISSNNETSSTVSAMPQTGDDIIILDSGDHTMFENGSDTKTSYCENQRYKENMHSIGTSEVTFSSETIIVHAELGETELEYHSKPDSMAPDAIIVKTETSATWVVATAATHHATGNRDLLSGFTKHLGDTFLHAADGTPMKVLGSGNVVSKAVVLPDVWYVPGLTANLVSVSQLAELDYSVGFGRAECYIRNSDDGGLVGSARVGEEGLFEVDFLKVPFSI